MKHEYLYFVNDYVDYYFKYNNLSLDEIENVYQDKKKQMNNLIENEHFLKLFYLSSIIHLKLKILNLIILLKNKEIEINSIIDDRNCLILYKQNENEIKFKKSHFNHIKTIYTKENNSNSNINEESNLAEAYLEYITYCYISNYYIRRHNDLTTCPISKKILREKKIIKDNLYL